jgi:hypothetical protein
MEHHPAGIAVTVERARRVGVFLQKLGWLVAALGVIGIVTYSALWATGEIDADQGVSLILGTALAVVLSGATSYGAGVNLELGAERLDLAAKESAGPAGQPASLGRDHG